MSNGASLALIISGKDDGAKRLFDDVSKSAQSFVGHLGNIATAAAGIAIGAGITKLPGLLLDAAKAAAEEEVGVARLQQAVENAGVSWEEQGAAVEALVGQREKLGFSDDALRSSLAILTAQTGSLEEAQSRQKLAMDLSRGANIDLETASKLVGKVTDENVNVLKRYGISVEKGASSTELFAKIQEKFGGQAEAAAKTAAVQWEIFTNQMGNLQEDIGSALLPLFTQLGGAAVAFVDNLRESGALTSIVEKLGASFQVLQGIIESVFNLENTDALQIGLEKLFGADSPVVGQAFDMILAITDAIKGGAQIIADAWNTVIQVFQGDWSASDSINPVVNMLGRLATVVRDVILPNLAALGRAVQKVFSGDMAGALAEIGPVIQRTAATLGPLLLKMGQAFIAWIAPQIPPMLAELGKLAAQLVAWIGTQVGPFAAQLLEWGKAFIGWIAPQIPGLLEEAGKLATKILTWAGEQIGPLTQQLLKWGKAFIGWVGPQIPLLLTALGKLAADIIVWIVKQGANFALKLLDWGLQFVKWVIDVVPKLPGELAKIATAIINWVTQNGPGIATKAAEMGKAFITGIINGLADLTNRIAAEIGSAVQRAIDLVRARFGGETSTPTSTPTYTAPSSTYPDERIPPSTVQNYIPSTSLTSGYTTYGTSAWPSALFPSFASGGIVPGSLGAPMLAVVHGGEEFSGVGRRLGGGGINVNINLGGVVVREEADEDRLVRKLSDRMQAEFNQALGQGTRFPSGVSRSA